MNTRGSLPLLLICSLWNVLLLGAVAFAIVMNDQARDALLAMANDGLVGFLRLTLAIVAAALCAIVNWHLLRRVQMLVFPLPPKQFTAADQAPKRKLARPIDAVVGPARWLADPTSIKDTVRALWDGYSLGEDRVARHLARTVASLPLITLALVLVALPPDLWWPLRAVLVFVVPIGGLIAIAAAASNNTEGRVRRYFSRTLTWFAVVLIVSLALTLARLDQTPTAMLLAGGLCTWILWVGLYAVAIARRSSVEEHELPDDSVWRALFSPLVLGGRWSGWVPILACAILLTLLGLFPARAAALGPIAIILIGVAFWGSLGAAVVMAVYIILRQKPGSWIFVAGAALLIIGWTLFQPSDKRMIRTIDAPPSALRTVREAAEAWPDDRTMVLVAAEGGGIYAAYHTAMTLAYLEDLADSDLSWTGLDFSDHIFAISAVSGGSVGAAVYASLLEVRPPSFEVATAEILSHDLLSAVLAAGVGRDVLPVPAASLDRTRALEDALVHAWNDALPAVHHDLLRRPLSHLDPATTERAGPYLFLNTTRVATGEPRFSGPLQFSASKDALPHVHKNIREDVPDLNLSIVTAAVLSARFPIVTTAGQVHAPGDTRFSYVDGGYFENSGCATLEQVYRVVRDARPDLPIIILRIGAEPGDLPEYTWGDLLSPVATLANTRGAHGRDARKRFEALIESDASAWWHKTLLNLSQSDHKIPLGWLLSEESRTRITKQIRESATLKKVTHRSDNP